MPIIRIVSIYVRKAVRIRGYFWIASKRSGVHSTTRQVLLYINTKVKK